MMFTGAKYDWIKRFVQVILPATSSAYFALDAIWGLPAEEKVIGTIAVITTFLGVSLGISSSNYYKSDAPYSGDLVVSESLEGQKMFSLELDDDPNILADKEAVTFKVVPPGFLPESPMEDLGPIDEE